MTDRELRLGVAGLGRGFVLMLPTLLRHPRPRVVAAAGRRAEARRRFARDFGDRGYPTGAGLCAGPDLDAVYVAPPHGPHLRHVTEAARAGKHVLVEKPTRRRSRTAGNDRRGGAGGGGPRGRGHGHGFDAPYRAPAP